MNANAFRHLYDYHFSENRKIWDHYITSLSQEQFTHPLPYSHGSVRDQIVHLLHVDELWFSELQNVAPSELAHFDDRENIRKHWDRVETGMQNYLDQLGDHMLLEQPIKEPEEDKELMVWQVLLHVVNHGTDHRAQILRLLNDLGVETTSQDYIFYAYGHALPSA